MAKKTPAKWLLLIHQIPPKPDYLRVKIWRRLQQIGAVAIKQSVYALPRADQSYEDFSWILKEIIEGGGDGSLSEAVFLEGLSDEQIVGLFQTARDADYEKIIDDARSLAESLSKESSEGSEGISRTRTQLSRLKRRFEDVAAIDFFGAPGRNAVEGELANVTSRVIGSDRKEKRYVRSVQDLEGRTWVTRKGVYVDRIACAWLIRRFVDRHAKFKFVSGKSYKPKSNEIRFDMFDAEFTHKGDWCTFEVMIDRLRLDNHAISQMAEIIHDIDLKDKKFARVEAAGIQILFDGITATRSQDEERLERSFVILDEMYESFSSKTT
jgi:hypothetical protein